MAEHLHDRAWQPRSAIRRCPGAGPLPKIIPQRWSPKCYSPVAARKRLLKERLCTGLLQQRSAVLTHVKTLEFFIIKKHKHFK